MVRSVQALSAITLSVPPIVIILQTMTNGQFHLLWV